MRLVEQYGPKRWSVIAMHLPGRIGKQCRERCEKHNDEAYSSRKAKNGWTDMRDGGGEGGLFSVRCLGLGRQVVCGLLPGWLAGEGVGVHGVRLFA